MESGWNVWVWLVGVGGIYGCGYVQVQSMDDNCGGWVECMGVASGCGEQEAGVASGSGWNLWVWLLGVVVRRYIDLPHPLATPIHSTHSTGGTKCHTTWL